MHFKLIQKRVILIIAILTDFPKKFEWSSNMAIVINTNMQALFIMHNLQSATDEMNQAMERLSSGLKINSAKDDPAGFSIAQRLTTKISAYSVASDNVKLGSNLLGTAEGTLNVIADNLQRIDDLITQASNGTYSDVDKQGIAEEIQARVEEIESLAKRTNFNGISLFSNTNTAGITLQVGTEASDTINLDSSIFAAIDSTTLSGLDDLASTVYNFNTHTAGNSSAIASLLGSVSNMLTSVVLRVGKIGAAQNRLDSTLDWISVQKTNLIAAKSTIMDADVAEESAKYVAAQIRQAICAALLVQANSTAKLALTLIKGASLK